MGRWWGVGGSLWIISAPLSKDSSLEGIYSQKQGCSGTRWGISYFGHSKPNWPVGRLYPAQGEGSALLHVLLHTSKPWLWSQVEQRETQGRAEMSPGLSQGNGPPGTGAPERDYFGQVGHKMSLTYGNILLCCNSTQHVLGDSTIL